MGETANCTLPEGRIRFESLPINKLGTSEALRNVARAGTQLTVQHESFSELGAKISWLRSGYLALFATAGYEVAFDPAMQIVRKILECDERLMITFTLVAQQDIPLTERRILRVLAPQWDLAWLILTRGTASLRFDATCRGVIRFGITKPFKIGCSLHV